MTDEKVDQLSVAAGPSSANSQITHLARDRQVRPLPLKLNVQTAATNIIRPSSDTPTTPKPTATSPPLSSTHTNASRIRRPQEDLFSQLLDDDNKDRTKRKYAESTEEQRKKGKNTLKKKLRWKDDAELVEIRLIRRTSDEEDFNLTGLSHQDEGEMLRKPKAPLKWYEPLPLIIPIDFLNKNVIHSIDASLPGCPMEEEEGEGLDVRDESPVEQIGQRSFDRSGLLSETAMISLPDYVLEYIMQPEQFLQQQEQEQLQLQQEQYQQLQQSAMHAPPTQYHSNGETSYEAPVRHDRGQDQDNSTYAHAGSDERYKNMPHYDDDRQRSRERGDSRGRGGDRSSQRDEIHHTREGNGRDDIHLRHSSSSQASASYHSDSHDAPFNQSATPHTSLPAPRGIKVDDTSTSNGHKTNHRIPPRATTSNAPPSAASRNTDRRDSQSDTQRGWGRDRNQGGDYKREVERDRWRKGWR